MCFHFFFGSSVGIPVGIASEEGLKTCEIIAGMNKYKSIVTKKKKKQKKIVLLEKTKKHSVNLLISNFKC